MVVAMSQAGHQLALSLADGDVLVRRAVFVAPKQRQQTDLAKRVGCRVRGVADAGAVEVDSSGRTSVEGIWAAGTTAQPALLGIAAAGAASTVAVSLHTALLEAELRAEETGQTGAGTLR